ncbi:MAG TPA: hypothetical protein VG055_14130 [Planctomycetaceae bacterium]|nr:hypothetical protein [Planctomycetaceae bacterium]
MHQIQFNQNGWQAAAANQITQIFETGVGAQKRYRITVGNVEVAKDLLDGDPKLELARRVVAILPGELQQLATQARQFGMGPAHQFVPPAPGSGPTGP